MPAVDVGRVHVPVLEPHTGVDVNTIHRAGALAVRLDVEEIVEPVPGGVRHGLVDPEVRAPFAGDGQRACCLGKEESEQEPGAGDGRPCRQGGGGADERNEAADLRLFGWRRAARGTAECRSCSTRFGWRRVRKE